MDIHSRSVTPSVSGGNPLQIATPTGPQPPGPVGPTRSEQMRVEALLPETKSRLTRRTAFSGWTPLASSRSAIERLEQFLSRRVRDDVKSMVVPASVSGGGLTTRQLSSLLDEQDEVLFRTREEKQSAPPDDGKAFFSLKQPRVDGKKAVYVDSILSTERDIKSEVVGAIEVPDVLADTISDYAKEELTEEQAWAWSQRMPPPIDHQHAHGLLTGHLGIPHLAQIVNEYADFQPVQVDHHGTMYDLPAGSRPIPMDYIQKGPVCLFPRTPGMRPVSAMVLGNGLGGLIVFTRELPPPGAALAGAQGPLVIKADGGFVWEINPGSEPVRSGYQAWQARLPTDHLDFDITPDPLQALQQLADLAAADLGDAMRRQHAQAYGMELQAVGEPHTLSAALQFRRYDTDKNDIFAPQKYDMIMKPWVEMLESGKCMLVVNPHGPSGTVSSRTAVIANASESSNRRVGYMVASYKRLNLNPMIEPKRMGGVWIEYFIVKWRSRELTAREERVGSARQDPDFLALKGVSFDELFDVFHGGKPTPVINDLIEQGKTFDARLRSQLQAIKVPGTFHTIGFAKVLCHDPPRTSGSGVTVTVFRPGVVDFALFELADSIQQVAPGTAVLKESASDEAREAYARGGIIYKIPVPEAPPSK